MFKPSAYFPVAAFALALSLPSAGAEKSLYAWKRGDGNVHYGDYIPPGNLEQSQIVYDERLHRIGRIPRSLTEREKAVLRKQRRHIARVAPIERQLFRQVLQFTELYTAPEQIDEEARLKREGVQERIELLERNTARQKQLLDSRARKLAGLESEGKWRAMSILKQDIESIRSQIARNLEIKRMLLEQIDEIERERQRKQAFFKNAADIRNIDRTVADRRMIPVNTVPFLGCENGKQPGACLAAALSILKGNGWNVVYDMAETAVLLARRNLYAVASREGSDGMFVSFFCAVPMCGNGEWQAVRQAAAALAQGSAMR